MKQAVMNPAICKSDSKIVFFPVRHHSPAAAVLLAELIEKSPPAAVLIEGPFDYNPFIDELFLPHKLPIAIYSYAHLPDGRRTGAFYPFCFYSPEWQALQSARQVGAHVEFIDIPWSDLARGASRRNRYADGRLSASTYIQDLCRKLGAEDFDALWDSLSEIDPGLHLGEYMKRMHNLCFCMRLADGAPFEDIHREAFMLERIEETRRSHNGKIIVVTGGFHSYALWAQLFGTDKERRLFGGLPEEDLTQTSGTADNDSDESDGDVLPDEQLVGACGEPDESFELLEQQIETVTGISLTPYSYERLDRLSGYESGLPGPGFYHQAYEDRLSRSGDTWRKLLFEAVVALRQRKQPVSVADVIAVQTTALGLAALRGHARVWRQDLLDGVTGALVKDEISRGLSHPLLEAVHTVMRGNEIGKLAPKSRLPQLVLDIGRLLNEHKLVPTNKEQIVELDLETVEDRQRSKLLHRLLCLSIPGFDLQEALQSLGTRDDGRIIEHWSFKWLPEMDAACIEASVYGGSLEEAATNRLLERAQEIAESEKQRQDGKALAAAEVLLEACLMGFSSLSRQLGQTLLQIVGRETDTWRLAQALRRLLYLYYYDRVLEAKPTDSLAAIITQVFDRCLWLLDSQGAFAENDKVVVDVMRCLAEAFERCSSTLSFDRTYFLSVLSRIRADNQRNPMLRGAATGMLWTMGETEEASILDDLTLFANPQTIGDFLTGLFSLAREVVRYRADILVKIDEFLMEFGTQEYLEALPHLRLAFSVFTPKEKFYMAQMLFGDKASEAAQPDLVCVEVAAQAMSFEERIKQTIKKYGLRGPHERD